MQLFFQNDIVLHTTCLLNEEESRHCAQVMRLKSGDLIQITNGSGSLFKAELLEVHHKKCVLAVKEESQFPKADNYSVHVAVAPTKNMDRMEWFVEKAVELGIDEITPVICSRSERKEIKTERLKKVAIAAMKQSLKYYLPQINEGIKFNDFVKNKKEEQSFICFGAAPASNSLHAFTTEKKHNLFLIGPEGDFTENEINTAIQNGFQALHLGASRLRTETAALHVVSIAHFRNNPAGV